MLKSKQKASKNLGNGKKTGNGHGDKAKCTPPGTNFGKKKSTYQCERELIKKRGQKGYSNVLALICSDLKRLGIKA